MRSHFRASTLGHILKQKYLEGAAIVTLSFLDDMQKGIELSEYSVLLNGVMNYFKLISWTSYERTTILSI